ncbi:MAG: hypothetical protein J0I76_09035 [Thiobacillus sp.]|nr:hypothetical protein [Thiobacillus sp.]
MLAGMGMMAAATAAADKVPYPANGEGHDVLAAGHDDAPLSKDDLFGTEPAGADAAPAVRTESAQPASKDDLFGTGSDSGLAEKPAPASKDALFNPEQASPPVKIQDGLPIRGFFQTRLAYAYSDPDHWSDVLGRLELGTQGRLGNGVKWKLSGRAEYNAVYDLTDFYADSVRHDQRTKFRFGETYLDFSTGSLDWRVGRQQIVWGEMVGLFFADVVSAKDLREFILSDFQMLRVPQWAARTEYFKDDFHAELIWIPVPSYDEIGRPFQMGQAGSGSDFYPYPVSPAGVPLIMGEKKPGNGFDHGNYGVRLSQLSHGWDVSGFWYSSMDSQATFYRDVSNPQVFYPRHDRIWQAGATVAKDFQSFVLKAEAVYTDGRRFNVTDLSPGDGLVRQNTLDWVAGLDFNPGPDTRVNTQLFQRIFFDHAPNTLFDQYESGVSLLVNHKLPHDWEAEALLIHSLNRSDWMLRPKLTWKFQPNWKLNMGVDVFGGPPTGLFGQYDQQDRVYSELRYDF